MFVIGDGDQPEAERMVKEVIDAAPHRLKRFIKYVQTRGGKSKWGHYQRNVGARIAKERNHLVFLDDDDVLMPDAFKHIKARIAENYKIPFMFSMIYHRNGHILPQAQVLTCGNVSGSCFVVPNIRRRIAKWPLHLYEGDFHFIQKTLALFDYQLIWCPEIIVKIRPHEEFVNPAKPPEPTRSPSIALQMEEMKGWI